MFKAVMVEKTDDQQSTSIVDVDEASLPEGDVTIDVEYSTLNYKDGLAITGSPGVVRSWPMVPGIDLAGVVAESSNPAHAVGDRVVLNGWGIGEGHWGGLAQKARVDGGWLVPLPDAFTAEQAMAIGTAGYTAMLCVLALEAHGVTPDRGPVIVTGAAGGVGSTAVAILAKLGYEVAASTGRPQEADYLTNLGASEIIDRATLSEPGRPMGRGRWAGAVDSVGSHTLANVLATTLDNGCVAACGLAQGADLPASVLPFILRGVVLAGVNSVTQPIEKRIECWNRLATDLDASKLASMTTVVPLAESLPLAERILAGDVRGRVVVDVNA